VVATENRGSVNVARLVLDQCARSPDRIALVIPRGDGIEGHEEIVTFRGLAQRVAQLQAGLARAGFREGDRVVMLFPVSVDFYALALAILASGMTVVLIDGALGVRRALVALSAARPRAIVSVRAMLKLWPLLPPTWRARRFSADGAIAGVESLDALVVADATGATVRARANDDEALITFTSGSTGRPKGVDRTHGILCAQHFALRDELPERDDDVDMTCFPAVALHNLCCGMTTVLPPMDLRKPASVVGERVLRSIDRWRVTRLSGAPAFLDRVVAAMEAGDVRAPSVRAVVSGGAPVTRSLSSRTVARFREVDARVLYGSTEAEPIASAPMAEVAREAGDGYLVGRVAHVATVRLVDDEVQVSGPHVNRRYVGNDEATRQLKVRELDGRVWHRTGDLARRDATERLWLTGRRADIVVHHGRAIAPFIVEADANAIDGVASCALVSHARAADGELVVVLRDGATREDASRSLRASLDARDLGRVAVRFIAEIPMDARHQSKVDRVALRSSLARSA
jgi:acyl-coenzyme A synthetase/AMP-(fatty) acid ligase